MARCLAGLVTGRHFTASPALHSLHCASAHLVTCSHPHKLALLRTRRSRGPQRSRGARAAPGESWNCTSAHEHACASNCVQAPRRSASRLFQAGCSSLCSPSVPLHCRLGSALLVANSPPCCLLTPGRPAAAVGVDLQAQRSGRLFRELRCPGKPTAGGRTLHATTCRSRRGRCRSRGGPAAAAAAPPRSHARQADRT